MSKGASYALLIYEVPNNYKNNKEDESPMIIMNNGCFSNNEYALILVGCVKKFNALLNLLLIYNNEGFSDDMLGYLSAI